MCSAPLTKICRLAARWVNSSSSSGPKKWTVWVPATVPPRRAWTPISSFRRLPVFPSRP